MWSSWSSCSQKCGGGFKIRTRSCDAPKPKYGGARCRGNYYQTISCNTDFCPGNDGLFVLLLWRVGVEQRWENAPPANVARVRFRPCGICGWRLCGFSRYSAFPSAEKPNISKFRFDHDRGPTWKQVEADVASSLNIVILVYRHWYVVTFFGCQKIDILNMKYILQKQSRG